MIRFGDAGADSWSAAMQNLALKPGDVDWLRGAAAGCRSSSTRKHRFIEHEAIAQWRAHQPPFFAVESWIARDVSTC